MIGAHDKVLDYADLFSGILHDDNVPDFETRWDEVIFSITKIPSDHFLESLHKLRTRESDQLKTVLEMYDIEIHQKLSMPDYQKLKTMVKISIDQKLRLRNFDARNEIIETGTVVTNRRGQRGVERGQGECYQWNAKGQCSQPTPPSHKIEEVEVRREKGDLRGRSPSGKFARQPCRDCLKGICTKSPCDIRHPPECKFNKPSHRQVEKPKKDGDKSAVAMLKDAGQLGCVFQDMEPPESSSILRKSTKVLGSLRRVPRSVMQTFDKTKVRRSENFKSKFLISAVPTL